jgi:uncharacterized caspase-like protein
MGTMLRAVVVGINEYKDERYRQKARLQFASSDAQEIAALLGHSQTFTTESVVLLQNEKATRKAVRDSLNSTFSQRSFDSNTIALFYFAGHGIVNPHDKRISLCCHDVDFTDPEAGGIRLNDVYDWLASSSAECVIAIIDACFSGGMVAGNVDHVSASQRAMQAIEALRYPEGKTVAIFAACGSDEKARERASLRHGIFTYELVRGWRDGAAQERRDGIVYLLGLANFLTQDLTKYVQKPQITMRSSRPIALWQVAPSATNAAPSMEPAPAQLSHIAAPPISTAGQVYHQVMLPTERRTQSASIKDRNKLFILFACLLILALAICGLSIFFIVYLIHH